MTISANFPQIAPSLDLDFANSVALDPRISYSRSTTGTYYDGQTSALAEQNLITYSQGNNSGWSTLQATQTANATTDPLGGNTAWTLFETVASNRHVMYTQPSILAGIVTFSVYLQANTRTVAQIQLSSTGYFAVLVNLSTGSIITTTSSGSPTNTSSTISQVGSSTWYRVSVTMNSTANPFCVIALSDSTTPTYDVNGNPTYLGVVTNGINVWGAQLEYKSTPSVYIQTSGAAITNYIPQLLTAPVNQPRFDFNPTTRQSLGLLIEQQSTNYLKYSSDYTQSVWSATNATSTGLANIAPDGTLTASLLTDNSFNGTHGIAQTYVNNNYAYVTAFSVFVKANPVNPINWIKLCLATSGTAGVTFNIPANGTGTVGTQDANFFASTIQYIGNGWYRCTCSYNLSILTGTSITVQILTATSTSTISYIGSGQSVYVWGAQVEPTYLYSTSYIPTLASQVTRAQDFATMTGTNFSSWFNSQQGTVYCSFDSANNYSNFAGGNFAYWGIDNNSSAGYYINKNVNNSPITLNQGSQSANFNAIVTLSGIQQTAYSFNNTNGSVATSGVANGGSGVSISSVTQLSFLPTQLSLGKYASNSNPLTGHIRKFAYYPIATTATQLQALTGS